METLLRQTWFLCVVLSVSMVKHRAPGSCWTINLDNCSGVSCQQNNSLFRGIACHLTPIYLVGFMVHNNFKLAHFILCLCFSSMPTLKIQVGTYCVHDIATPRRLPSSVLHCREVLRRCVTFMFGVMYMLTEGTEPMVIILNPVLYLVL